MSIDVSIIFVNYKTPELTKDAILSVKEKSLGFSYEIIVVDNSNDDEEFLELQSLLPENVQIINPRENLGFGKANNLGSLKARGKYLFFLNTDTLLINNAIYELFSFSEKRYPCVAGSNLYTRKLKPWNSYCSYIVNAKNVAKDISLWSSIKRRFHRNDFNYSKKPLKIYGYVCGASLMIPRTAFEEIGGFDKDIFMYAEETLLCYRLSKEKNMAIYNVPSSKIIHFEGGSQKGASEAQINRSIEGNKVYFSKAFSYQEYIAYLKVMVHSIKQKRMFCSLMCNKKEKLIIMMNR